MISLLLSACSTISHGPFRETMGYGGYKEKQVNEGTYQLEYYGDKGNSYVDVISHFNLRAAELCGSEEFTGTPRVSINRNCGKSGGGLSNCGSYPVARGEISCTVDRQSTTMLSLVTP